MMIKTMHNGYINERKFLDFTIKREDTKFAVLAIKCPLGNGRATSVELGRYPSEEEAEKAIKKVKEHSNTTREISRFISFIKTSFTKNKRTFMLLKTIHKFYINMENFFCFTIIRRRSNFAVIAKKDFLGRIEVTLTLGCYPSKDDAINALEKMMENYNALKEAEFVKYNNIALKETGISEHRIDCGYVSEIFEMPKASKSRKIRKVYDRKYIDTVTDIVCDTLEIRRPLTVKQLCKTIETKLPVSCVSKDTLEDGAKIIILDRSSFIIVYSDNTPECRLLFSIAHELGHIFLHYLKEDGSGTLKTEETVDIQEMEEWEANEFAAYLLMPDELFISKCRDFSENGRIAINKIADYFHVNIRAVTVRGQVLGLWI